jgi:chaperonin GroES
MNAGAIRFQLGEYKTVNMTGGSIKDNIVPFPAAGPSAVLFELLGFLVEAGKEIAAVKDVLTGDQKNSANVPATTTLALIEQGLKVFTAIYKRVHRALKSELNKLYRLNRVYGDERSQYKVGDTWKTILKQDYVLGAGVEPVSDPTMVSDMQRMGRAQFLLGFRNDPNMNGVEILTRALKAADIDQIEKLIVQQTPPNPVLAIKGMEMDQKEQEIQAGIKLKRGQEFAAYASAIKSMAEADAVAGDQHIQWLNAQLTAWQTQFEAATAPVKGADGTTKPGGEGPPPPPMQHPATIPSGIPPSTDNQMQQADPDGNGRVSPSAGFAAEHNA